MHVSGVVCSRLMSMQYSIGIVGAPLEAVTKSQLLLLALLAPWQIHQLSSFTLICELTLPSAPWPPMWPSGFVMYLPGVVRPNDSPGRPQFVHDLPGPHF